MTPAAYAVGLARHAADGRLLDAWFPRTNVGEHPQSGARILAAAGLENGSVTLPGEAAEQLLGTIHGINADTIRSLLPAVAAASLVPRRLIVAAIASLDDAAGRRGRRLPAPAPALARAASGRTAPT